MKDKNFPAGSGPDGDEWKPGGDVLQFPAGSGAENVNPNNDDMNPGNEEMIFEAIMSMAKPAAEMKEAIEDLPLQIETLARVLLARQFIYVNNGNFDFHRTAFENIWAQIANVPG